MPIYEYSCLSCECRFEALVSLSSETVDTFCPKCGSETKREVSLFALISRGLDMATESRSLSGTGCGGCGPGGCGCSM